MAASLKLRHTSPQIFALQCQYSTNRGFSSSAARLLPPPPYNSKSTSSSAPLSSPSSSAAISSSASSSAVTSTVNPPASTRPAALDLPSKSNPETSGTLSYYFALGKAYLGFYKTGLKNVYANYKTSIPLRKQLGLPVYIPRSPWTVNAGTSTSDTMSLTRSDFQLVRRSAYDIRRTIPFAFILLLCGEMTPFVVLAIGNRVTPMTCRMPKQLAKERGKRTIYKDAALQGIPAKEQALLAPSSPRQGKNISELSTDEVLRSCVVFGLRKRHDLPFPGFLQTLLVNQMYRPKLQRWMEYLAADDKLIASAGGVKRMIAEEVRLAVDERGGVEVGMGLEGAESEKVERKWLTKWMEDRA